MRYPVFNALIKGSALAGLLLCATLPTPTPSGCRLYAAQDAVYQYEVMGYSAANVTAFHNMILAEQNGVLAELASKYADKPEKIQENAAAVGYAHIISGIADLQENIKNGTVSEEQLAHSFIRL